MKTPLRALRRPASTFRPPQRRHSSTAISPRWLSELPPRIGNCLTFGTSPAQTEEASSILDLVARDWRTLLAGSEGFLTSPSRRGLYRQAVVWGDMDSMVPALLPSPFHPLIYLGYSRSLTTNQSPLTLCQATSTTSSTTNGPSPAAPSGPKSTPRTSTPPAPLRGTRPGRPAARA